MVFLSIPIQKVTPLPSEFTRFHDLGEAAIDGLTSVEQRSFCVLLP